MSGKKMERPKSDNPLSERIFLRVDKQTKEILDKCVSELKISRSEVARKGIYKVYDDLKK